MAAATSARATRNALVRIAASAAPSLPFRVLSSAGSTRTFVSIAEDGTKIRDGLPKAQGLYDPSLERDSCGVG
jgi:hypothetical protein